MQLITGVQLWDFPKVLGFRIFGLAVLNLYEHFWCHDEALNVHFKRYKVMFFKKLHLI